MSAVVTDQFRISNAGNFVDSVLDTNNNYYVFLGLSNPTTPNPGFGRTDTWNTTPPNPIDNLNHEWNYGSTSLFGKKVNSANIRRVVRKVEWKTNTAYDMYRQDYSINNKAPVSDTARLYDANYFVVNSDYNVYICIENGSSGSTSEIPKSKFEPTFTDLEPSAAGSTSDGYTWKYLYTISPNDIIKFDSTEYIVVPNDWATSTNSVIQSVREAADSTVNFNQIKTVYIKNGGDGYNAGSTKTSICNILGDGSGGKVSVTTTGGVITNVTVTAGGSGYTYGMVDLGTLQPEALTTPAELIVVIPPSRGHGYDIYKDLGADRVLVYARFDDSTKDFPTNTKFAQVGIVKNPTKVGTSVTYTDNSYSSLQAFLFSDVTDTPVVGEKISQTLTISPNVGKIATGYVASYDKDTKVLKYFRDRSLNYTTTRDQTDYSGISTQGQIYQFETGPSQGNDKINQVEGGSFKGTINNNFTGISTNPSGVKLINLGVSFSAGLSNSEINKGSGEIVYLDNRPLIARNERQKEDIKIILEF